MNGAVHGKHMSDPKRDKVRWIIEYLWQAQVAMERIAVITDEEPLRREADCLAKTFQQRGEALRALMNDDDLPTVEQIQKIYHDAATPPE